MQQNSAGVFSENWSIYQKIIRFDYMHHAVFAKNTADVVNGLAGKNLQLLDIGCGDAVPLLPILQGVSVASYTGYDLSASALQLASLHLRPLNFPLALKEGNMIALIQEEEKQFNIIHSSFAIHHLQDEEKQKLLKACYDRLLPGSKMIYTDIFREQDAGRDRYIDEYFSFIKNEWPLLTEEEKQPICEHVRQYDFPSDMEETITWIRSVGFSVAGNFQPDHRHAMLVLAKE